MAGSPASALDIEAPLNWMDISERYAGSSWEAVAGRSSVETELLNAGEGARGIVYGSRADGSAHVFNAVVQRGQVNFVDFQGIGPSGPAAFDGYVRFMFLRTG